MTPEKIEQARVWYRERLADPTLIDRSVIFDLDCKDIAVPVGGTRRAGYINFPTMGDAQDEALCNYMISLLVKQPELFPNLRWEHLGIAPNIECLLRWGVDEKQIVERVQLLYTDHYRSRDRSNFPMVLLLQLGRLYGFTDSAIIKHLNEHLKDLIPPIFAGEQDEFLFSQDR